MIFVDENGEPLEYPDPEIKDLKPEPTPPQLPAEVWNPKKPDPAKCWEAIKHFCNYL